jgi:hypothetical protein
VPLEQSLVRTREPVFGNTLMASNSADPTSSYRYFDGSSFWPSRHNPDRTSAANCVLWSMLGIVVVAIGIPLT